MKIRKLLLLIFLPILIIASTNVNVAFAKDNTYYLGGMPAGFILKTKGANVIGLCDVVCGEKISSPSKDADIQVGDIIISIDNIPINSANDIKESIKDGKEKLVVLKRQGETICKTIEPAKNNSNEYKIGVFVRDSINGIGTITFFTKDKIGCLGHPVLNEENSLLDLTKGEIFPCSITGYLKGIKGRAGELRGVFLDKIPIGDIYSNNYCGVFANITCKNKFNKTKIELGQPVIGEAFIYTTIDGNTPKKYSIQIVKVSNEYDNKDMVIKITDEEILQSTGGIVQGMSGSPIVQNNKLVGAVTHVFINDPTRGFGINISKMVNN